MKNIFTRHCKPICVAMALLACCGPLQSQGYRPQPGTPAPPDAPVETPAQIKQRLEDAKKDAQKRNDERALVMKAQAEAAESKRRADELAVELKAAKAATAKAKQAEEASKVAAALDAKAKTDAQHKAERERIASAASAKAAADTLMAAAQATKDAAVTPGYRFEAYPAGPVLVVLPKIISAGPGSLLGMASSRRVHYTDRVSYEARLPYTLAMGEAEVTFAQWNQCVKDNACNKGNGDRGWGEGERPVMNISWNDIQGLDSNEKPEPGKGYLNWLNKKAGIQPNSANRYRLPTEAEWELAARAGSDGEWSLGADNNAILSDKTANYDASVQHGTSIKGKESKQTVPIKNFQENKWGLWDMHGNVGEWVQDCYEDETKGGQNRNQAGGWNASQTAAEIANCIRVLRGGSWSYDPRYLRSANRGNYRPGYRDHSFGFRLARTLP